VTYGVAVSVQGGETYLRVDRSLAVGSWPKLGLASSDVIAPSIALDSDQWPPGVAWSVNDRLKNGGDEKGRVIAIWHRARHSEATPFAVLTWHTEGRGPFYLFDVGGRMNLNAPFRRRLEALLLEVMLEAARHPEAPVPDEWQAHLRWTTVHFLRAPNRRKKEFALAGIKRAKRLSFDRYEPPPPAPAAMAKGWLGERDFS
jgi:hypothetical protein